MAIQAIRFRVEGEHVVLQVQDPPAPRRQYHYEDEPPKWRDAKVEDLLEVAAFTRAYDALDKIISGFQSQLQSTQDQMASINEREMRRFQDAHMQDMKQVMPGGGPY